MLKLIYITNHPGIAEAAVVSGVDRIMVDLEIMGKQQRQGHRDTVISAHSVEDIARVRQAVPDAGLIVRVNPVHDASGAEVEAAVAGGADHIMLPMFTTAEEVAALDRLVAGRAGIVPLIETPEAVAIADELTAIEGVSELFVGLNDLHLALKQAFMFEPVAEGLVDRIADIAKRAGMPFGFGGIARMHEGNLPGRLVLTEHLRIGSGAVILSRTFYRADRSGKPDPAEALEVFQREVTALREVEAELGRRGAAQVEHDRRLLLEGIAAVSRQLSAAR